jgi:hypothetical protein
VRESGRLGGYLRVFSYRGGGGLCKSVEVQGGICNTPSPLRLGLSHFFFYNKIFAKIHKVYQST